MTNRMSGRVVGIFLEVSAVQVVYKAPYEMSFWSRSRGRRISGHFWNNLSREQSEMFRFAQHDSAIERRLYAFTSSFPVNRRKASTYFADVFSITSFGRRGAGGVLFQSSV